MKTRRIIGYLVRSALLASLTLTAIAALAFFMSALSPGIWEGDSDRAISPEKIMELKKDLRVDRALFFDRTLADRAWRTDADGRRETAQPWHALYNFLCAANGFLPYMKSLLLDLDFGDTRNYEGRAVGEIIRQLFPISAALGTIAFALTVLVGVPLGTLAAVRHNTFVDRGVMAVIAFGVSVPSFILAMAAVIVFSFRLDLLPPAGWGRPEHAILPSLVLAAPFVAYVAKITRASMLEIMRMDFIRTARAKGLPERLVIVRHALRLAIIPVVNFLGPAAAMMVTGSVVVEQVFAIPGLGNQFVNAATGRDVRLVCGLTITYSALIVAFNLLADIAQRLLDPTISERAIR